MDNLELNVIIGSRAMLQMHDEWERVKCYKL